MTTQRPAPRIDEVWKVRGARTIGPVLVRVLSEVLMSAYGQPFCWVQQLKPRAALGRWNKKPCETRDFIERQTVEEISP